MVRRAGPPDLAWHLVLLVVFAGVSVMGWIVWGPGHAAYGIAFTVALAAQCGLDIYDKRKGRSRGR